MFLHVHNIHTNFQQAEQPRQPQFVPPPPYYDNQKQQEFAAEEAYWARRIENLKRAHEKINSGMHIEYQKTLKEANELFDLVHADKGVTKLAPCQEEKAKVVFHISFCLDKFYIYILSQLLYKESY